MFATTRKELLQMSVIQCQNGHFYDDMKFATCPHCTATPKQVSGEDVVTVAMYEVDAVTDEQALNRDSVKEQDAKTVAIYGAQMEADPVVGWLVSLVGPEKGRDYRLHSGRNFIGRSLRMDVLLADDDGVSRENHCSVVYDPESNIFSVVPGDGTNTYLNDCLLTKPEEIMDDDVIRLGTTELVFIAFCNGVRKWQ